MIQFAAANCSKVIAMEKKTTSTRKLIYSSLLNVAMASNSGKSRWRAFSSDEYEKLQPIIYSEVVDIQIDDSARLGKVLSMREYDRMGTASARAAMSSAAYYYVNARPSRHSQKKK